MILLPLTLHPASLCPPPLHTFLSYPLPCPSLPPTPLRTHTSYPSLCPLPPNLSYPLPRLSLPLPPSPQLSCPWPVVLPEAPPPPPPTPSLPTWTSLAPLMTWKLVTTWPSLSQMKPLPTPGSQHSTAQHSAMVVGGAVINRRGTWSADNP